MKRRNISLIFTMLIVMLLITSSAGSLAYDQLTISGSTSIYPFAKSLEPGFEAWCSNIYNYEPNNYWYQATSLDFYTSKNTAYVTSCIFSNGDVDWFYIQPSQDATYSLTLTANNTEEDALPANYNVQVYDSYTVGEQYYLGSYLGGSANSGSLDEQVFFSADINRVYIKVYGWNNNYSTTPYKLVIQCGDAVMFREGTRYRDCPISFFDRQSGTVNGNWYPAGSYEHPFGVAYGYGSKDSFSHYVSDMDNCNRNAYPKPPTNWSHYSSSYPRPGRWKGESIGTHWCGIDCSGFVQRCAQASKNGSQQRYECRTFTTEDGLELGDAMNTASFYSTYYTKEIDESDIVTGDVFVKHNPSNNTGHIVMFSRIDLNNIDNSMILEAQGDPLYKGGRIVKENYYSKYRDDSDYKLKRLKLLGEN